MAEAQTAVVVTDSGTDGPRSLPFSYAQQNSVLLDFSDDQPIVVHQFAPTIEVLAEMRRYLGQSFALKEVSEAEFQRRLTLAYQRDNNAAVQMAEDIGADVDLSRLADEIPETGDLMEAEDDAPIIRLINAILSQAVRDEASDIHIETFENSLSVRYRIDGVMMEVLSPKKMLAPLLVSRLKVMARLDIAEKRVPQDGRISVKIAGHSVDIRMSTIPSAHGERVVLRLLDTASGQLELDHLAMNERVLSAYKKFLHSPHGIILVTGPTGSGKTTTLYAGLSHINEASRNILTIEDPIEYMLPGVGQTQVNPKVDMTFARGLRAILRQDPDIVMVGEIRDLETAEIAVQASLTGHLVLSTLHTNTAIGAITRLKDMGIEPFLLSSSLLAVMSQRLVRLLCTHCKQAASATRAEREKLGLAEDAPEATIYKAKGCEHCSYGGYRGRTGIYEMIEVDETIRAMIYDGESEQAMLVKARQSYPGIEEDGRHRVLSGDTSMEEVLRVTAVA
jgi:general secretion pathway protein E